MTRPKWFLITTPIPDTFSLEKTTPSKLIFIKSTGGGCHLVLGLTCLTNVGVGGGWQAVYSASLSFEIWEIWCRKAVAWLSRTWLRWVHIPHAIIAKSSTSLFYLSIHDSNSLKSRKLTFWRDWQWTELSQNGSNSLHSQRACSGVSWVSWQQSQNESSMIVRRTRAAFVGIAFRHARHNKFLT